MTLALLLSLYVVVLLWTALVWHRTSRQAAVMTPLVAFGISELCLAWTAPILAFIGGSVGFSAPLWTGLAFLAFAIGYASGARRLILHPLDPRRFRDAPIEREVSDRTFALAIALMLLVLIGTGTWLHRGVPALAASLGAIIQPQGQSETLTEIAATRKSITKGHFFGEAYRGQGALRGLQEMGWPFVTTVAFALAVSARDRKRRSRWWAATFGLTALTMLYVGGAGVRSPVIGALIVLVCAVTMLVRVGPRHVAASILLFAGTLLLIAPLGQTHVIGTLDDRAHLMLQRVFVGNGINNMHIIEFLDDGRLDYGLGQRHLDLLRAAWPGVGGGQSFGRELNQLRLTDVSVTAQASPSYFGRWFADFGGVGTAVAYGLTGVAGAALQRWMFTRRKTVSTVVVNASALSIAVQLPSSAITGAAVQALLLLLCALAWQVALHFLQGAAHRARPGPGPARARLGRIRSGANTVVPPRPSTVP